MTPLNKHLTQQNQSHQDQPMVKDIALERWFTGADLDQDIEALKAGWQQAGLGRGDVLMVCVPNSAVFIPIDQAAWQVGIAVHPVSPTSPASELLADRDEHHYAAMLLLPDMAAQVRRDGFTQQAVTLATLPTATLVVAPADRGPAQAGPVTENDLALILATSGTTGKPKRVGLSQRLIFNAATHDAQSNDMHEDSVALITMPMFHINAQVMVALAMRMADGKLVIAPKFSASRFWNWVADNGVNWTSVVPTIVGILLLNETANQVYHQRRTEINLMFTRCSSFALPEDQLRTFQNRFNTHVIEGYGMTESASQCTINPLEAPKIGSAGKPFGTKVKIRQQDGTLTTAPSVLGEIVIAGDHVIDQYMDPHEGAFADGWFLTGDLGYFDEDGYLFVKGRAKEIISRGGEKVAPAHVENVLDELPFIAQLCVIGLPDPLYGEAVTAAIISTTPGENEEKQRQTVLEYGRAHLAKYEAPTKVMFLDEFPRNQTGKVLRPMLKQWLKEGDHVTQTAL